MKQLGTESSYTLQILGELCFSHIRLALWSLSVRTSPDLKKIPTLYALNLSLNSCSRWPASSHTVTSSFP